MRISDFKRLVGMLRFKLEPHGHEPQCAEEYQLFKQWTEEATLAWAATSQEAPPEVCAHRYTWLLLRVCGYLQLHVVLPTRYLTCTSWTPTTRTKSLQHTACCERVKAPSSTSSSPWCSQR